MPKVHKWRRDLCRRTFPSDLYIVPVVLAAALLTLRCLLHGVPLADDAATHVDYLYHFSRQFWNGELYPRWLAEANKGAGSPVFLIQYPLPYFVSAFLRPLLGLAADSSREARELGFFLFIALATAGTTAYCWFRTYAGSKAAAFAAVIYLSLPYVITDLYQRCAIGELAALAWLPAILASLDSPVSDRRSLPKLALWFSLLILSNTLIALLFVPVAAVYAVLTCSALGTSRSLLRLGGALLLAFCISAVYFLPALWYRGLFSLEWMSVNVRDFQLGRFFLYLHPSILHEGKTVNWLVVSLSLATAALWRVKRSGKGSVASASMSAVILFGLTAMVPDLGPRLITLSGFENADFQWHPEFVGSLLAGSLSTLSLAVLAYCHPPRQRHPRQGALLLIACAAFLLMLPISAPLWKAIPALQMLQFPFRLNVPLTVATAGLLASLLDSRFREKPAVDTPTGRGVALVAGGTMAGVVAAAVIAANALGLPSAVVHTRSQVDMMYRSYVSPSRLTSFAQRIGTNPTTFSAVPTAEDGKLVAALASGRGVTVARRSPRTIDLAVNSATDARIQLRLLYSPLWKVHPGTGIDAGPVRAAPDGFLEIPCTAGCDKLQLQFEIGSCEQWGEAITVSALLLVVAWYLLTPAKAEQQRFSGGVSGSGKGEAGLDR
ncbi:hypothetical protein [Geomonas sp.]|uniref:hypothetical protein n=1 Tax=Geomonas sp. TaxID=2651584 RepID=UPI002B47D714|nr:hypothetical protein [Geomonas sp.]HJV36342.1 hypothetical protein [Geomonas sp.]